MKKSHNQLALHTTEGVFVQPRAETHGTADTRSRSGCTECRRQHRKCDETRPQCLACVRAGRECSYRRPVRWRAQFALTAADGSARSQGDLQAVPCSGQPQAEANSKTATYTALSRRRMNSTSQEIHIPAQINALSWLSSPNRYLLDHFLTTLTQCISLHPTMHADFGSTLAPLALDTTFGSHLLSACLVAAARHRRTLGTTSNDAQIDRLATYSLGGLARQPIGTSSKINEIAAATALVLCVADIQAGGEKPGSWKLHLNGAKAILNSSEAIEQSQPSRTSGFLRRWCRSLDIISLSAGRPDPKVAQGLQETALTPHIDMFEGYSTALLPLFQEMGLLAASVVAIQLLEATDEPKEVIDMLNETLYSRAFRLDGNMSDMAKVSLPVFNLSSIALKGPCLDYQTLNEAFHHSTRLELRHNLLTLPLDDPESAEILQSGIQCLKRMALGHSAPSCKTLHVAFSLGIVATNEPDRNFLVAWLDRLHQEFGMGNVLHAKSVLSEHWRRCDAGLPYIRPRHLAYANGLELILL